jgi:hypothetical protein
VKDWWWYGEGDKILFAAEKYHEMQKLTPPQYTLCVQFYRCKKLAFKTFTILPYLFFHIIIRTHSAQGKKAAKNKMVGTLHTHILSSCM